MHHFIFLVEDVSGKAALEIILDKIGIKVEQYEIHHYKGLGRIPENLGKEDSDPKLCQLLTQLPRLLKGFTARYQYTLDYTIFVLCDLDDRCLKEFRDKLLDIANKCGAEQTTQYCISVKEMEAWLLGDFAAVKRAYPKAKLRLKNNKKYDERKHGSWEILADSIKRDWSKELKKRKEQETYKVIGELKSKWAEDITPYVDMDRNTSTCFNYFKSKIQAILTRSSINAG